MEELKYNIKLEALNVNAVVYEIINNEVYFKDINSLVEQSENIIKDDVINKKLIDLFPGVKEFGLYDKLLEVNKTGIAQDLQLKFYNDERIQGWRENHIAKVDENLLLVTYKDLTKEKQLEYDLDKLIKALDASQKVGQLGTWDWDIKTGELWWSKNMIEMFGYSEDQFESNYDSFILKVQKDDRERVNLEVEKALANEKNYDCNYRIIPKKHTEVLINAKGIVYRDEKHNPIRMIGTVRDITQSVKKQEVLSKYVIYSRTDIKGIITEVSDYFINLSGYSKEELIGSPHNIIRHPDSPSSIFEEIWKTIQSGETWKGEIKNRAKDGHHYWVNSTISPEYDLDNNIIGYVSIREDITAKKDFEKQHLMLLEQAKMASLGEMIGNIAHQWRQPLSVISTVAGGIKIKAEYGMLENEELFEFTDAINKNAQYLSKTIDSFRDFLRAEKTYKDIALKNEIDQAIDITLPTLKNNHIKLKDKTTFSNDVVLKLVAGELAQVLINIINNAKDAILEKNIENGWIEINLIHNKQFATISIEDNAGGIPDKIISRIFEPYFSTKHKSLGTGLGLHMSYNIITESLHGNIYVNNTKNGARFVIELPIQS